MSKLPPELRRRKKPTDASSGTDSDSGSVPAGAVAGPPAPPGYAVVDLVALFVVGFALRFYRIAEPASVVFDEYHFGKFVNW